MSLNLEREIRNYAHKLIADHAYYEYTKQVGRWEDHIDNIIEAEKAAIDRHQNVLNRIADEERAQMATLMFALSLAMGPALSWIAAKVQYDWFPKFTGKPNGRVRTVMLEQFKKPVYSFPTLNSMSYVEVEHSKVMAKVFGDLVQNSAAAASEKFVLPGLVGLVKDNDKRPAVGSYTELGKLTTTLRDKSSSDEVRQSLREHLKKAFKLEREATGDAIMGRAAKILNSQEFPGRILEMLYKHRPLLAKARENEKEWVAKGYLQELVDKDRRVWADNWVLFGQNPPSMSVQDLSTIMEREIWAFWVSDGKGITSRTSYLGKGETTQKRSIHRYVHTRLQELGIVTPMSKAMDLITAGMSNPNQMPTLLVEGAIDTESEIKEVQEWAGSVRPSLMSGRLDGVPRDLKGVLDYTK